MSRPFDDDIELRVLAGVQAGARLRLEPGIYRVGTADDCDIVLSGRRVEPHAATLEWDGSTLTLTLIARAGEDGATRELALGVVFGLGELWLCVDRAQAPWPQDPLALEPAQDAATDAGAVPGADDASPDAKAVTASGRGSRLSERMALFGLAALALTIIGGTASVWALMPTKTPAASVQVAAPADAERLTAMLKSMNLGDRVAVRRDAGGSLQLWGFLPTTQAVDQLRARLVAEKAQDRAKLDVAADDWVLSRLQALAEPGDPWQLLGVANGVLTVAAADLSETARQRLEARLQGAGVRLRSVSHVAPTLAHGRDRLQALLRQAGLQDAVRVAMEGEELRITGQLGPEQIQAAGALLDAFNQETGGAVVFQAVFEPPPGRLPFRIVQVVGGANPSVVSEDGQRIFVGGEHKGYRLAAFQDGKLVFAGRQSDKVEIDW